MNKNSSSPSISPIKTFLSFLAFVFVTHIISQLFPELGMRILLVEIAIFILYWIITSRNTNDATKTEHDNHNSFTIDY